MLIFPYTSVNFGAGESPGSKDKAFETELEPQGSLGREERGGVVDGLTFRVWGRLRQS